MSDRMAFRNISESTTYHIKGLPNSANVKKAGNDFFEVPGHVVVVTNTNSKKEYLIVGYLLSGDGSKRETVVVKDNISDVVEIPLDQFDNGYRIHKAYREGIVPELIYLNGVPDKITSGQHWVPKNNEQVDVFNYVDSGRYASDESPSQVWEVQSVVEDEVTLNLIQQEEHESGFRNRSNTHQTIKLTKLDLITNYRLHSHGFFLSNDFFKFIDQETYVSIENKDKVYMMNGGKGEFVQIDDMVKPASVKQEVKITLK